MLETKASVYVIECEGLIKIGVSEFSAQDRIRALQTGNPFPLRVVAEAEFSDAHRKERHFHTIYDTYRVRGEWFKLPPDILKGFLLIFKLRNPNEPDPYIQHREKPTSQFTPTTPYPDSGFSEWSDADFIQPDAQS